MSAVDDLPRPGMLATLCGAVAALGSRLAFHALNLPALFGAHRRNADLAYGAHRQQRLDVYTPGASGRRPVVVFWHGGHWRFGDKADYRFVGAALAALGCVAVIPNYRHYPEVRMAGFMQDAARAVAWADAHAAAYGGEPGELYLMGHSAGAHLAALLTLDRRYFAALGAAPRIAGVIGLSGPYDFLPLTAADTQDMFGPPENYPQSQPVNFVKKGEPRMLLIHGLKDDVVRPKNARSLAAALAAADNEVSLKLYAGVSHADTVAALSPLLRSRASTLNDIRAFIRCAEKISA